ncbi:MAG: hypothetical protein K1W05_02255, partial [Desulfovibrio sp.]
LGIQGYFLEISRKYHKLFHHPNAFIKLATLFGILGYDFMDNCILMNFLCYTEIPVQQEPANGFTIQNLWRYNCGT